MSLQNIVAKLGGDLWANGSQANIPGPGHSKHDRSVTLRIGADGRVVVNTWGRSQWWEVMDDLRDRGLIDENKMPIGTGGRARTSYPDPVRDDAERLRVAAAIWSCGSKLTDRSLAQRHAVSRRIERLLPGPTVLRNCPAAPIKAYDPKCRRTHPAMLAAVCDRHGAFTAVEVTYLDPNARRSRQVRLSRKTIGPVPPGSAIRIDEVDEDMVAGEGLFSSLSGSERFALPAWALLSTRNMRSFVPPRGVRRLLIAADRGADGEASANIARDRARANGVRAWVEYPPLPFGDWNEAAEQKGGWPTRQGGIRQTAHATLSLAAC